MTSEPRWSVSGWQESAEQVEPVGKAGEMLQRMEKANGARDGKRADTMSVRLADIGVTRNQAMQRHSTGDIVLPVKEQIEPTDTARDHQRSHDATVGRPISIREAARLFGVSSRTVSRWIERGITPPPDIEHPIGWKLSTLRRWIQGGTS